MTNLKRRSLFAWCQKFTRLQTAIILKLGLSVSLVALGGCVGADDLAFQANKNRAVVLQVDGADIIIGGTSEYCISSRRKRSTGAFVILSPCSPGSRQSGQSTNPNKGLLILSVSSDAGLAKTANTSSFASFFKSKEGLRSLSNSGEASTVEVLGTLNRGQVFYIHTRDSSGPMIPDTTSEQWRGFFVVSERVISISVVNFIDNPIPDGIVFTLLEEFAERIKKLNAGSK